MLRILRNIFIWFVFNVLISMCFWDIFYTKLYVYDMSCMRFLILHVFFICFVCQGNCFFLFFIFFLSQLFFLWFFACPAWNVFYHVLNVQFLTENFSSDIPFIFFLFYTFFLFNIQSFFLHIYFFTLYYRYFARKITYI